MRDDSGVHLKSISTQLQREREREANMDDVNNCDKPEGKTNNLGGRGWEALASATISILFYRDSEILN